MPGIALCTLSHLILIFTVKEPEDFFCLQRATYISSLTPRTGQHYTKLENEKKGKGSLSVITTNVVCNHITYKIKLSTLLKLQSQLCKGLDGNGF